MLDVGLPVEATVDEKTQPSYRFGLDVEGADDVLATTSATSPPLSQDSEQSQMVGPEQK